MKYLSITLLLTGVLLGMTSCNDFLDETPRNSLSPESYFYEETQLLSYVDDIYPKILPGSSGNSYGFYAGDNGTDNQIDRNAPSRFDEGQWKVPLNDDNWGFETIYRINYFFSQVMPRFGNDLNGSENTIKGNLDNVKHYIGEMYFLRAAEYFSRYQKFGDFPIITEPLNDNQEELTEASKRFPRNEVARFILDDLETAIQLLGSKDLASTRINRDAALLLKSRVALYEGTWLKYFKGTAFVPGSSEWPGNKGGSDYQYPSGSIDNEVDFFLTEAMEASKEVADKYVDQLTQNTGILQQDVSEPNNPYYDMFASEDLSTYPEVLLWRQYVQGVASNDMALAANQGNWGVGVTRSFVQNYLMKDGTPTYHHGSYTDGDGYYMGDKTIMDVRMNRDERLVLFLKEPQQKNVLIESIKGLSVYMEEPYPSITSGDVQRAYTTGYALRKAGAFDTKYLVQNQGSIGIPIYRAAEALLNYMEASYEKSGNGSLDWDQDAMRYWNALRTRAGITGSIQSTISATTMAKEAENDWGAYSGGTLVDPIIYNIRRERRCEFISEGLRYMDLCRWRAMDQLKVANYIPEGIHLWGTPMQSWYDTEDGGTLLKYGGTDANVSAPDNEYIRPYQRTTNQRCYNGFTWHSAHYLYPVPIKQMQLTSSNGVDIETSPIYQNPYWPTSVEEPAIQ